jgi:hypothetical protein
MQYTEMLEKTGVLVSGIVNGHDSYTSKPTAEKPNPRTYNNLLLIVKGMKDLMKIGLPEGMPFSKYPIGTLVQVKCLPSIYQGKMTLEILQ